MPLQYTYEKDYENTYFWPTRRKKQCKHELANASSKNRKRYTAHIKESHLIEGMNMEERLLLFLELGKLLLCLGNKPLSQPHQSDGLLHNLQTMANHRKSQLWQTVQRWHT